MCFPNVANDRDTINGMLLFYAWYLMVDFFHGSYAEENAILDSIYSFEDYWDGMLHGRKIVNVRLQIVNTAFVSSS